MDLANAEIRRLGGTEVRAFLLQINIYASVVG